MTQTIATHSGNFHLDDICAVATLQLLLADEEVNVVRTREEKKIADADYVVDVGGTYDPTVNRFDHHQEGFSESRENGIVYASFGLVWKEYGETLCGSTEVADIVDERLVQSIDALDNGIQLSEPKMEGVYEYSLHSAVSAFRPTWKEDEALADERFQTLVTTARELISREIQTAKDWHEGVQHTQSIYEHAKDKRIIILDKRYPWKKILAEKPEPLYVVYPGRVRGYWRVKTVSDSPYDFKNRKPLPKAWAGKRDEALQKVTGVDTAVFSHNERFLIVAKEKEDALQLAKKALAA